MDNICCAAITTFNPNIDRLKQNIDGICSQVSKIYVFDNDSKNIEDIEAFLIHYQTVELIRSNSNKGIAYALNCMTGRARHDGYQWILTLDQDSVCPANMMEEYRHIMEQQGVGIICPLAIDDRRGSIPEIPAETYSKIQYTFTSGSLVNIKISEVVGDCDDYLFVGFVDTDFCRRVSLNGYSIIRCNKVLMNQEFGNITKSKFHDLYKMLYEKTHFKVFQKLSYEREVSPFRVEYAVRNHHYLAVKYLRYKEYQDNPLSYFIANVGTLIRAQQKVAVARAMVKGILEGVRANPQPYQPRSGGTHK